MKSNAHIFAAVIASFNRVRRVPSHFRKRHTWNKPHQGAQECARRVRQGNAPSQYNKNLQYPYQFEALNK